MGHWASRIMMTLLILAATLLFVTLLILSPMALRALTALAPRSEWTLLSDIGQAYGPAAVFLTVLTLMAVAYTALLQLRTTRIMSQQAQRTAHFELIRLALDEPALAQADGSAWDGPEDDFSLRLLILANAWLTHWWVIYNLGQMTDAELRGHARKFLEGEAGRRYWARDDHGYRGLRGRRSRAFVRIMDEELRRALSSKPRPTVNPNATSTHKRALVAFSAGAALALGVTILRKRRF
ncbi:DUF6082 family protein [Nonomuraea maritima]|uniref:DUF6082 family protein n=1 Tax=Nonomuraea maritima TaxID=683260 RepID=UPI003716E7BF